MSAISTGSATVALCNGGFIFPLNISNELETVHVYELDLPGWIYCIIWVCNADVCYQKRIAHLYLWNISVFYVWLIKVIAPHAGTQWMGTVVKTCYEWLIWCGTSGNSWCTAALWHTERDCMGDGCVVAERGFMTAAVNLYERSNIPHTSTSPLNHTSPFTEPLTSLVSSRSPFLPSALLFSFSTSHSLFLCHTLCTPLALLPWQPWVKNQHVEKQRWGFWLCLWEREMGSPSLLCLGQHEAVFLVV